MTGTALQWQPRTESAGSEDPRAIRRWATAVALLPTVALVVFTVGTNTPLGVRLPLQSIGAPLEAAAVLGPAVAALLLGVTVEEGLLRVALLFAGVFGFLALVSQTAAIPAVVVMAVAGFLIGIAEIPQRWDRRESVAFGVLLAFALGLLASTSASLGVEPALARRIGSLSVALGIAGTPVYSGISPRSLGIGIVVGILVFGIGMLSPVMTAAVSLLGFGIIGLPLVLSALAAVGGVTTTAAGVERGRLSVALAGLLVLFAGVPTTISSGVAVLVALAVFVTDSRTEPIR